MPGQQMMVMMPAAQVYGQQGLMTGQMVGQPMMGGGQVAGVQGIQGQVYGQGLPGRSYGSR